MKAELYSHSPVQLNSVAIVGGGVAAACLAFELLQQSPELKIEIFCKDHQVANAASGNRQGAIYPLLQASESNISLLFRQSYLYALEFYQSLSDLHLTFEHQWCGVLQQAITPELENRFNKISQLWSDVCQFEDAKRSSALSGLDLPYSSLYFPAGGWLSPQQLCIAIFEHLKQHHDLSIVLNQTVTKLQQSDEKWSLTLSGRLRSEAYDAVVLCSGIDTLDFDAAEILPLEPIRGQVSHAQHDSPLAPLKTVLCHKGYITPSQGDLQCFGATFDKGNRLPVVTEEDALSNIQQIKKVYPSSQWAQSIEHQHANSQRDRKSVV